MGVDDGESVGLDPSDPVDSSDDNDNGEPEIPAPPAYARMPSVIAVAYFNWVSWTRDVELGYEVQRAEDGGVHVFLRI